VIDFSTLVNRFFYLASDAPQRQNLMAMKLGDRILARIEDLNATREKAQALTVRSVGMQAADNPNLVRDIIKGKVKSPRYATICKIAQVLDLDPAELTGEAKPAGVPMISWVSAGVLRESDHVEDMETAPRVPASDLDPAGHWIALRVEGDSMDRISPPDSLIFVNTRDRLLVPNACYVFSDSNGGTTYKRWRPNPNRLEPVSTNPCSWRMAQNPASLAGSVELFWRCRRLFGCYFLSPR